MIIFLIVNLKPVTYMLFEKRLPLKTGLFFYLEFNSLDSIFFVIVSTKIIDFFPVLYPSSIINIQIPHR